MIVSNRKIVLAMARNDISGRYLGQVLGSIWLFVHPIFMMALWVFIFSVVFKAKVSDSHDLPLDYVTYLLAGLVPWLSFQDVMARSSTQIIANGALIRQGLVMPIVLPVKSIFGALLTQLIMLMILCCYVLIKHGVLPWTYLLIPFLIVFQVVAMIGVAFLLSSITVFVRDVKDVIGLFVVAGPFMMPLFYFPEWVPEAFRPILYLNPFSYLIWCYQDLLFFGEFRHWEAWGVFGVGAVVVFCLGYRVFRKLQNLFGNFL